jgi:hemerythrin superfamily protein
MPSDDSPDILDTLKKEHEEASDLLAKIVESEKAGERKALLKKLKAALAPHLVAEEKVVYRAVSALKDDKARQDGSEGKLEHDLAMRTLVKLGKISNAASPEFSAAAKVLKELVEHHVEEEESNIWDDVRENFSDQDRASMNRAFEIEKKKVAIP